MKIIFICCSLEPNRDGVGDYTRMLASELQNRGNATAIIALNDKFINVKYSGAQKSEGSDVAVLRMPSVYKIRRRIDEAKKYINEFDPDLLSLQFVIFGFHPKGLPFGIGKKIRMIGGGRTWHIMFHEIWIGITRLSPGRHKFYGYFQRQIIKSIINRLKPEFINTSNYLYQLILSENNISAEILPLFSNIPITSFNIDLISEIDEQLYFNLKSKKNHIIGVFGSLYVGVNLARAISEQLQIAEKNGQQLIFLCIGRIGMAGMRELERLKEMFKGVFFFSPGELSPELVSILLQVMDIGVSGTPSEHLGKSGAFAAMRHHGLNVIAPARNPLPEYDQQLGDYQKWLFERAPNEWGVGYIAASFVNFISNIRHKKERIY